MSDLDGIVELRPNVFSERQCSGVAHDVAFKGLGIIEFPRDNESSSIPELTNITSLPRPTAS